MSCCHVSFPEMTKQGALEGEIPNVIIGPFYTNLAMILERLHIPYVVTDYKVLEAGLFARSEKLVTVTVSTTYSHWVDICSI